ncbi:MAG: serine--tRNA ligase [Candidatus Pacebacteria bacterium]|nr:serine--tRNA ligase [Candidatus Paceibacterota bacterium]
MLDIKFIRQNPKVIKEGAKKKNVDVDIDKILELDKKKKEILQALEDMRAKKNAASKKIGSAKTKQEKDRIVLEMKELDRGNDRLDENMKKTEEDLDKLLIRIPNLPLDSVPVGRDDRDNVVQEQIGEKTKFDFPFKDYMELSEKLDLIDVKRASKVAGSRFGFLRRQIVLLEFALINFTFEALVKKGFIPIIPPVMLKPEMAMGMGYIQQLDDEDAYYLPKDNLFLIGTAEQPLGAMHSDEVLNEEDLPLRYAGFSTCFRREAGSYGKDTKGILRVHQFDKVEMFSYSKPEDSSNEHEFLLETEKELMKALKIPFQVLKICSGDLGFPAAAKYDIEAWLPSENKYRETHSTSNCTDFQARRLNIKYKKKDGKLEIVHTLNGTAFAIGRILIAIIENYQQEGGSIRVPEVLQKYVDFKEIK